jgi:hypothetical protein
MHSNDPEKGITWARGGLIFGVLTSVAGNVSNVIMTDSASNVAWRIPGAVVWPLALFVGIEVMVRNRQHRNKLAYLGRALLMVVSVTTFTTSFVNLNGFMAKTDEPWLARFTGPIGVDTLMLGCTVFLLAATLVTEQSAGRLTLQYASPIGPMPSLVPAPVATADDVWTLEDAMKWSERSTAPVSPAPIGQEEQPKTRTPRGETPAALEAAVRAILANQPVEYGAGASRAVVARYAKVARALRNDPRAEIDAAQEKVRPEMLDLLRTEILVETRPYS